MLPLRLRDIEVNVTFTRHVQLLDKVTLSNNPKCLINGTLKGTKRQYSGQMSQIFKTAKTIEIQLVRLTKVCGKV